MRETGTSAGATHDGGELEEPGLALWSFSDRSIPASEHPTAVPTNVPLRGLDRSALTIGAEAGAYLARLSVRLVMQAGVEAEVDAFLGRTRYERRTDEHPAGSRNGWQPPATIKTTMVAVEISRPKLRETDVAFCSRLLGREVTRTNALEALVISGWVRGLSDRDIEAALAEVLGPEAALARSTECVLLGVEKQMADFVEEGEPQVPRPRLESTGQGFPAPCVP